VSEFLAKEGTAVRRILAVSALGLALLAGVLLLRAALLSSRQLEAAPAAAFAVDPKVLAERLALAIRIRTISHQDSAKLDPRAFLGLHGYLAATYPAAHAALERETLAGLSLLYTWQGRNPELRPVLLAAHQDVVPVEAESEADWTHPPFDGVVREGVVWGRGAMDNKASMICLLEAVERLVREGFRPERTVYLAFGHDEEIGGDEGANQIAKLLASRGVALEWVIDEGGVIAADLLPGIEGAVAVIGIAEKGSVSVILEVEAPGGHSSTPPRHTAIGNLASAVAALERHPMPASIDGATALFLDYLAPELPFSARIVLANRWLFGPALRYGFSGEPALDAMLRTTTAVTIFEAGVKENVLPKRARAVANFRIHQNDNIEAVVRHVRETIDDERIRLHVDVRTPPRNPSVVSPVDSEAFLGLARTIREVFPGVAAAPYLVVGGADARHYHVVSENIYRFGPYVFGRDALQLAHGTNERITAENLVGAVRFYTRLIQNAAGPSH
jgi:carboxypeptidase PM20D1